MLTNKNNYYVSLAKSTVEHYVKTGERINCPENLSEELLSHKAGVFVSIKKNGELRGCIGTIEPVTNCIAEEIISNAISACSQDYRFEPVRTGELTSLNYSVDVLSPTQSVASDTELNPRRYGVVVTNGNRRGVLLPNLEGVDTVEQQVSIALKKAGIDPTERYALERFEVIRYKQK
jgi:MEMO1 family protein